MMLPETWAMPLIISDGTSDRVIRDTNGLTISGAFRFPEYAC